MFNNRQEAGEKLALKLKKNINSTDESKRDFIVVALLRGGIILGKKISDYLKIPLMPLAVKKIGAPPNPELAIGAVTFDKISYFDNKLIKYLNVDGDYVDRVLNEKWKEIENFQNKFVRKNFLEDKKVIIVDDGVATGATAICASFYAKKEKARQVILAAPVIEKDTLRNIRRYFDKIVSLRIVNSLGSVGQFYKYFPQITDEEVLNLLI